MARAWPWLLPAMLVAAALPSAPARAAGALDACTGIVSTAPYTITSPGRWCLDRSLVSVSATPALHIDADNVVLDCAHHTLEHPPGGSPQIGVHGILATEQHHVTVRNCNVVGFTYGITLRGRGALVVEDNHVVASGGRGIVVETAGTVGSVIRGNRVLGTRSQDAGFWPPYGIYATDEVDILDNTVDGVAATQGVATGVFGIYKRDPGGDIIGNRVRHVEPSGGKPAYAIYTTNLQNSSLRDNDLVGDGTTGVTGLRCGGAFNRARNNVVLGFPTPQVGCGDAGGNEFIP